MKEKAVIFDLDGVIVSTDNYHYLAWKRMADEINVAFSRNDNEALRGVSRMESLEIILRKCSRTFSDDVMHNLAEKKNEYYKELLLQINEDDILPGVMDTINELKEKSVKIAIGSSSRNAKTILERIGLMDTFDVVVDGNDISRSKPDPEVFLLAAERLGVSSAHCIVVEDAHAGIEAAVAAGMDVLGVGSASNSIKATYSKVSLEGFDWEAILA